MKLDLTLWLFLALALSLSPLFSSSFLLFSLYHIGRGWYSLPCKYKVKFDSTQGQKTTELANGDRNNLGVLHMLGTCVQQHVICCMLNM